VPETFDDLGDAFVAALPNFGNQMNALGVYAGVAAEAAATSEATATSAKNTAVNAANSAATSAASALTAPGTSATSTTSLTIGTGAKALTIQTGKAYAPGQFVTVASTASPTNYMLGQIMAYDAGTGALNLQAISVGGAGTFAAWTVALTAPGFDGNLAVALNEAAPVTLASAATVDVGAAAANTITITGTTAITSLGTKAAGAVRRLVFAASLILTHNAGSLILPGAADIQTFVGDVAEFVSLGAGNWRCVSFTRARGPHEWVSAIAANTAAKPFTSYVLLASLTLTLPAAPVAGDWVRVTNRSTTVTAVIGRNGQNIMGLAEAMTIDSLTASFRLMFVDSTRGWVLA
jgi:hypothetical protein